MKYYIFGHTDCWREEKATFDIWYITSDEKEANEYRKIFETLESSYEIGIFTEYKYFYEGFEQSLEELKTKKEEWNEEI